MNPKHAQDEASSDALGSAPYTAPATTSLGLSQLCRTSFSSQKGSARAHVALWHLGCLALVVVTLTWFGFRVLVGCGEAKRS